MDSLAFWFDRVALTAGIKTPIYPSRTEHRVNIGNGTAGDLEVHSTDANDLHYFVIAADFDYDCEPGRIIRCFDPKKVAFWLKATASGTVILKWS